MLSQFFQVISPSSRFELSFSHFSVNFSFNKCVKGFVLSVQIMTPFPNGWRHWSALPKICRSWHLQGATIPIGANVSVSLSSLPPVIKYALTKWSQSVKVKFCHFSESSSKIWSLGIRSRVCFHSFQNFPKVSLCHYSADSTIIQKVFIIMSSSIGSFHTLFMFQLCLGKVHFPLLGFWRQFLLNSQIISKTCIQMFIHLTLSFMYLIKHFPSLRFPKFLIFSQTLVSCYNLAIF